MAEKDPEEVREDDHPVELSEACESLAAKHLNLADRFQAVADELQDLTAEKGPDGKSDDDGDDDGEDDGEDDGDDDGDDDED